MTVPSLIYAIITILLALIDAIRVKRAMGKVPNISHAVSYKLAGMLGGLVIGWWWVHLGFLFNWWSVLAVALMSISFVGIRVAVYDLALNIFRLLMKTNPTGEIDYVSTTTTSYVDQHTAKFTFWMKRIMGASVWIFMVLLYKVIFRV